MVRLPQNNYSRLIKIYLMKKLNELPMFYHVVCLNDKKLVKGGIQLCLQVDTFLLKNL